MVKSADWVQPNGQLRRIIEHRFMRLLRSACTRSFGLIGVALSFGLSIACQRNVASDSDSAQGSSGAASENVVADGPARANSAIALQTAELMVEGTSCASCAVSIRRHLHKLQGIGEIREGSSKQHLLVEFDPELVTAEQLVKAVSEAGYEAEVLVHAPGVGASSSVREQLGG